MIKFRVAEYMDSDLETKRLEKSMSELGKEGWEAINVFDLNMVDGKSCQIIATFKRPIETKPNA